MAERYAEKYAVYRRLYPALREVNVLLDKKEHSLLDRGGVS